MALEIILDTETTGIDPKNGHRLIEIGCLEVDDLIATGKSFHHYFNPERLIEPDAIRVHGITDEMVANKPLFSEFAQEMIDFIGTKPIVAHNAAFDRNFVNSELLRLNMPVFPDSQWIDTLDIARKKFPGMANSLDALCKRFDISLAERDKHGALLDAKLLSLVYLELLGGKERSLDLVIAHQSSEEISMTASYGARQRPLTSRLTQEENAAHQDFIHKALSGKSLWKNLP